MNALKKNIGGQYMEDFDFPVIIDIEDTNAWENLPEIRLVSQ
jgi:hypothetical protein